MFCPKCGKEIADDAVICIGCGRAVQGTHNENKITIDPAKAGKIKVKRNSSFIGLIMPNSIIVDGKKVATLWNGQEIELDVNPGKHTMWVKQMFIGSQPVEFNNSNGQYYSFECGNNIKGVKLLILPIYALLFSKNCLYLTMLQ